MSVDDPVKPIGEMRLLGGLPALDFVNTVDSRIGRWGPDLLVSFDALVEFAERVGVLTPSEGSELRALAVQDPAVAALAYAHAKEVREATCKILVGAITASAIDGESLDLFNAEVTRAATRREVRPEGRRLAWIWKPVELGDVASRFASASAELLLDDARLSRVKQCPGRNCGWLFLDETRNGRRRWCSEETCGVHSRVLRYRQNRAQGKALSN